MPYTSQERGPAPNGQRGRFIPRTAQQLAEKAFFLAVTHQPHDDQDFGLTEVQLKMIATNETELVKKMTSYGCDELFLKSLKGVELAQQCVTWMMDVYFANLQVNPTQEMLFSWLNTGEAIFFKKLAKAA